MKQKTNLFLLKNKKFSCPSTIYFPSEDSYFLAENVKINKNDSVIDVGCGSGIQTLNAFLQGASKVTSIDLNKEALKITQKNSEKIDCKKKLTLLESNLFEKCKEKADVIIFNPPYLISDEIKYLDLDGGKKGRETLDKFIKTFPEHLKRNGKCFFLQTNLNGYGETEKKIPNGITCKIIAKRKSFFEELAVYKCVKK